MSIVRDIGLTVKSLEDRRFISCSTALVTNDWFSSGNSTANAYPSSAGAAEAVYGRIFDRMGEVLGSARFQVAMPATNFFSTRGSTNLDRQFTLGVRMQHGDSSGGGDMANYSTGSASADKVFWSTARSSESMVWDSTGSTGGACLSSLPAYYDLRGAKRFVRAVHICSANRATTETTGDEGGRVSGTITFLGADLLPLPTGAGFTSTSTSTST